MNENSLLKILNNLQNYKHDKSQLLLFYIQKRLDSNLSSYYKKLNQSVEYLKQKNSKKILKKLNRQ